MPLRIRTLIRYPYIAPPPERLIPIGHSTPWTEAEDTRLKELWNNFKITKIADMMQRSRQCVADKARKLGLRDCPTTSPVSIQNT